MMKAEGKQKAKNIIAELLELEKLTEEFRRLKAKQAEILRGLSVPAEALVTIESDLYHLRRSICARDIYTNPRRHIEWN